MSTKRIMGTNSSERRQYRSWPAALKREIVEASLAPGASASVVARRYGVNANQLFGWRKCYREEVLGEIGRVAPATVATGHAPVAAEGFVPAVVARQGREVAAPAASGDGRMEVVSSTGHRVIVDRSVDVDALVRLIRGLEELR